MEVHKNGSDHPENLSYQRSLVRHQLNLSTVIRRGVVGYIIWF